MKIELDYPFDNATEEFLRKLLDTPVLIATENNGIKVLEDKSEKKPKKEKLIKADEPEKITVEQLRKVAAAKGNEVGRDKVVEIINSFDASNLGEIAEDDYVAFLEKINSL